MSEWSEWSEWRVQRGGTCEGSAAQEVIASLRSSRSLVRSTSRVDELSAVAAAKQLSLFPASQPCRVSCPTARLLLLTAARCRRLSSARLSPQQCSLGCCVALRVPLARPLGSPHRRSAMRARRCTMRPRSVCFLRSSCTLNRERRRSARADRVRRRQRRRRGSRRGAACRGGERPTRCGARRQTLPACAPRRTPLRSPPLRPLHRRAAAAQPGGALVAAEASTKSTSLPGALRQTA